MRTRRQRLAAVALTACVLLAGCTGGATTAGDAAGPDRSIEVTADGEASGAPDRATVLVAVESTGPDARAVRDELAAADDALRTALFDRGLTEADVRTERYDVRQRRAREPSTGRDDPPYVGTHVYALALDDVDAVGDVIDVAIRAGADRVERVQFGLTAARETAVRERALTDAMDGARGQADVLASHANLTITGVHTVSTTNVRTTPYRGTGLEAEAAGGSGGPTTGVEPGDVDVSVTVRVVFAAEPT